MRCTVALLMLSWSPAALACGGLFCNSAQPVNQAAERILFAHTPGEAGVGEVEMHVRITYQGPPIDFGWILPAPRGVETTLSSEALFRALDGAYTPQFQLRTEFGIDCEWGGEGGAGGAGGAVANADAGAAMEPEPPPVQVLSREAIGPYDRAILDAPSVQALRDWLDANGFAIPEATDALLAPYIELDAVFVAIKLLAGAESGDVVPLRLTFPSDRPAIPIIPTAVAAEPDMGIIVHVLGQSRAIPLNYLHVQINEAAIDWRGGADNYADVVSAAADEAGGHAFATDYAGPLTEQLIDTMAPLDEGTMETIAGVRIFDDLFELGAALRDPDVARVLLSLLDRPPEADPAEFAQCPSCYLDGGAPVDGAALAERLREEVQPIRERLAELFVAQPYLTRLFSTMSPAEMDADPVFSFNADLDPVDNLHLATEYVECPNEPWEPDWANSRIVLADGSELGPDDEPIRRENGENVRGLGTSAAALVEQLPEAGPATNISTMPPRPKGTGGGSGSGCDCDISRSSGELPALLGLLALVGLARRQRRRQRPASQ